MQDLDLISRRLVHPAARIRQRQESLSGLARRMTRAAASAYEGQRSTLLPLGRDLVRLFRTAPRQSMALGDTRERWRRAAREHVAALAQRLGALERSLLHLSPQAVLERGYSIVTTTDGAIVQDAGAIAIGESIGIQFARGEAEARVTRTP
jgi:exodeoxyribonuclease VII large subunit